MPLDLESVLAMQALRQQMQTLVDDDLLCEPEEETCATCGGLLFEDEREPFALYCPDCDLVPH